MFIFLKKKLESNLQYILSANKAEISDGILLNF